MTTYRTLRRILCLAAVGLLACALPARAQTPNIIQYDQQVFAPGVNPQTGAPLWTNTYLAGAAVCNQAAPTLPTTVTNPTRLSFDDQAHPGMACVVPLASTLLPALPNGVGYVSTLTQTDNIGQASPRSAASNPFNRQAPPAVLTGLRLVP